MKDFLSDASNSVVVRQILDEVSEINKRTSEYNLKLSEKDVQVIVEHKATALRNTGRVEFGAGVITKIISEFSDSPYIFQQDYVEKINELVEIFYYYKNETLDQIGDDALIGFMKNCFDNACQGNIELLRHKYLEKVAHNVKFDKPDPFDMEEDLELDDKELEDEVEE